MRSEYPSLKTFYFEKCPSPKIGKRVLFCYSEKNNSYQSLVKKYDIFHCRKMKILILLICIEFIAKYKIKRILNECSCFLNLLNELRKRDKMQGLSSILSLFTSNLLNSDATPWIKCYTGIHLSL